MDPNLPEAFRCGFTGSLLPHFRRPLARRLPGRVVDFRQWLSITVPLALVLEHIGCMHAADTVNHRPRDPIQHDQALLAILHALARDDEHRSVELGHLHLVFPAQPAHLLLAQTRVHF